MYNDGLASPYYYRARYYHPTLSRFLSEDPLGLMASDVNPYVYVGNNPVDFVDPFGLDKDKAASTEAELPRPVCMGKFQSAAADYSVLNLSYGRFVGPQAQIVIDRYGRVYLGGGLQVGKAAAGLYGFSGYGAVGNLDSLTIPSRERLEGFLTGRCRSPVGVAVGAFSAPTSPPATDGVSTPATSCSLDNVANAFWEHVCLASVRSQGLAHSGLDTP